MSSLVGTSKQRFFAFAVEQSDSDTGHDKVTTIVDSNGTFGA